MAEAQIKNVIEKGNQLYIEPAPEYRISPRAITIRDGYLAGWNTQIVVIVENVSSKGGGEASIFDYKGNSLFLASIVSLIHLHLKQNRQQ